MGFTVHVLSAPEVGSHVLSASGIHSSSTVSQWGSQFMYCQPMGLKVSPWGSQFKYYQPMGFTAQVLSAWDSQFMFCQPVGSQFMYCQPMGLRVMYCQPVGPQFIKSAYGFTADVGLLSVYWALVLTFMYCHPMDGQYLDYEYCKIS